MIATIITAKNSPDLDGVASAIAYAYFLNMHHEEKWCQVAFSWQTQYEALYILKYLWLEKLDRNIEYILSPDIKQFILVDYSEKDAISKHIEADNVIEVINHKKEPSYEDFPNAKFRIEYVWAAATLIAEEFYFNQQMLLPLKIINLLYCAIFSNTMNYGTKMTWFRDLRMKQRLETLWADKELPYTMLTAKSNHAKKHLKRVLRNDDKLVLYENWLLVNFLQLEVADASIFLRDVSLLQKTIDTFHEKKQEVLCIVHLHDIVEKKTYLFSNYENFLWYIAKQERCSWEFTDSYIIFPGLFIRKDAIPLITSLLKKIDQSSLLQKFLE